MHHFRARSDFDRLRGWSEYQLDISDQDITNVTLAGLMHDLGHGIYSHLFDREFMPKLLYISLSY